jgi:hypothetical protein
MADYDNALHNKVDVLQRDISIVTNRVELVNSNVAAVQAMSSDTRSKVEQLQAALYEFVHDNRRRMELQRAETLVGSLQTEIANKYGYQAEVRRSAIGVLKAFDEGIVYQDVMSHIVQEVFVKAQKYWLSPALVALSEWTNGNKAICEKAIESAYRRSPSSTSLFFALIMRRQGRLEASLRWLRHYLNSQDPMRLTGDFATVLEAVAQGAFTAAGRDMVQVFLNAWREMLLEDNDVIAQQIADWRTEVQHHVNGTNAHRFPALVEHCPEWTALDNALRGAQIHAPLIEKYARLLAAETRVNNSLEDRVDDILDRLVKEFDPEEVPLQQKLAQVRVVVDYEGRVSEAEADAELASRAFEVTKDYLTVQTFSALKPAEIGVSAATQKVAIGACADWFRAAHDQHSKEYRSFLPSDVTAKFGGSHSVTAATFKLPPWTSSFNRPLGEAEASLSRHWDSHMNPWIQKLRYNWKRATIAPAIVVGLILLVVGGVVGIGPGLVIGTIVGGIWAWVIRNRYVKAEEAVAQARQVLANAKKESLHALRAAGAELQDWQRDFLDSDRKAVEVHSLIDSFRSTQGSATSSLEQRTVNTEGWN